MPENYEPRMELKVDVDGQPVISASGEIDISNAGWLRSVMNAVLATGASSITLDCAELGYVDSSTLAVLAEVAAVTQRRGGTVTITNATTMFIRLLAVTGLCEVVTVVQHADNPAG